MVQQFGDGSASIFVNDPPEFTIGKDGIARIRVTSGNGIVEFCCTPHVLLAASSRAMRAYVEWDAKERPEPIPIKKA